MAKILNAFFHVCAVLAAAVLSGSVVINMLTCGFGGAGGGGGAGVGLLGLFAMAISVPISIVIDRFVSRRLKRRAVSYPARVVIVFVALASVPIAWALVTATTVAVENSPQCVLPCIVDSFKPPPHHATCRPAV